MKRTVLTALAVVAMALSGARQARADAITYTFSDASVTGTIGATSFSDVSMLVTFMGDTVNVGSICSPGSHCITKGDAAVTLGGIGTFTLTDSMEVYVDNGPAYVAIRDTSASCASCWLLSNGRLPSYIFYDLTTAFGPVTIGGPFIDSTLFANTTGGTLNITSYDPTSTFAATTGIPEPGSLTLLGMGVVAAAMVRRLRVA